MALVRYFLSDLFYHLNRCDGRCELNTRAACAQGSGPDMKERIKRYYHENQLFYDLFWTDSRTLSMNYGFWFPETRTLPEAFLNQNKVIAEALDLSPSDTVLEAGCGTGGTSVWLAQEFGVKVIGITLSENQARRGRKIAATKGVSHLVQFVVMDFARTAFPDGYFTKIFASESVCYAQEKNLFLSEARRLLQGSGNLVVLDGFRNDATLTEYERRTLDKWRFGWRLPDLLSSHEFSEALNAVGFTKVIVSEQTERIIPSSKKIFIRAVIAYPIIKILAFLRIATPGQVHHVLSSLYQYEVWRKKICRYRMFVASR